MEENKTLNILKQAILLEQKGKAFYSHVARYTPDEDVRTFFQRMADEEEDHINQLTTQFLNYTKHSSFKKLEKHHEEDATADQILTEKIRDKIAASSFEAAAISSAIDMENRAIAVYSERSESADDPEEKAFYSWLAEWEKGHHILLHKLDTELKEKIWFDNQFWPF